MLKLQFMKLAAMIAKFKSDVNETLPPYKQMKVWECPECQNDLYTLRCHTCGRTYRPPGYR